VEERSTELEQAKQAYTFLEQARELHDNLAWSRINVMVVIQGFLITFFVKGFEAPALQSSLLISLLMSVIGLFGLVSSVFFWHMTKGSLFWVAYWIDKLAAIEGDVLGPFEIYRNFPPNSSPETMERLKQKGYGYKSTGRTIVKFSVLFIVMWAVALLFSFVHVLGFL
jgi:hypothetical protein